MTQRRAARLRRVGGLIALAAILSILPAPASAARAFGSVDTFASVPAPGHPFGVLATEDSVYVATSAGTYMHPNADPAGEAIFRYTSDGGQPVATARVATSMPTMGLYDMAADSAGRIYVVDMNGRVLRFAPTRNAAQPGLSEPTVYATNPYATLGWPASMWMNLAFDRAGNLYVTDASQGAVWIIPPSSAPRVPRLWLQCPQFATWGIIGLNGIAFGSHQEMYLVLGSTPAPDQPSATTFAESVVYRLPAARSAPTCDQLTAIAKFPVEPDALPVPWPVASGIAVAASGHLYVSLSGTNHIEEISADGTLLNTISNKLDVPLGIRFQGDSLLVANSSAVPPGAYSNDVATGTTPSQILKVYVGEPGLPLVRPRIP